MESDSTRRRLNSCCRLTASRSDCAEKSASTGRSIRIQHSFPRSRVDGCAASTVLAARSGWTNTFVPVQTFSSPAATAACGQIAYFASLPGSTRWMASLDRHYRWMATQTHRQSQQVESAVLVARPTWDMILTAAGTQAPHGWI